MPISRTEWPALGSRYKEEYGPIDLEVYEAARSISRAAEDFGEFVLKDRAAAFDLLHKAAAKVTAHIASGAPEIRNIQAYLFRTYKHLVAQELDKRIRHEQPLSDSDDALIVEIVADLERKIMLREIFSRINEDERTLALYLMFGYTYKEIAEELGTTDVTLRQRISRFRRKLEQILAPKEPS